MSLAKHRTVKQRIGKDFKLAYLVEFEFLMNKLCIRLVPSFYFKENTMIYGLKCKHYIHLILINLR